MAYEMVMPYHLHMPSYFLETFTEYPYVNIFLKKNSILVISIFSFYQFVKGIKAVVMYVLSLSEVMYQITCI